MFSDETIRVRIDAEGNTEVTLIEFNEDGAIQFKDVTSYRIDLEQEIAA